MAAVQCKAPGQVRAAVVRHGFAAEPQAGGVAIDMAVGSVLSAVVLDVGGALVKLPAQCAHFPSGEVAAEPGDVAACDRLELRRGVRDRKSTRLNSSH